MPWPGSRRGYRARPERTPRNSGSADAQGAFAAVEDERNDQVLLVGEVPREHVDEADVLVRIAVRREALPVCVLFEGPKKAVRRLGIALEGRVNGMMVGVQDRKATFEPRLGTREDGKVVVVLHIVVPVQLAEEPVEPWHEPFGELRRGHHAFAVIADAVG